MFTWLNVLIFLPKIIWLEVMNYAQLMVSPFADIFTIRSSWRCLPHAWRVEAKSWCVLLLLLNLLKGKKLLCFCHNVWWRLSFVASFCYLSYQFLPLMATILFLNWEWTFLLQVSLCITFHLTSLGEARVSWHYIHVQYIILGCFLYEIICREPFLLDSIFFCHFQNVLAA